MKIVILVEGETERVFRSCLLKYLKTHLSDNMPKIDFHPYNGRIPKKDKLKRIVENHLGGKKPADHVIALTDVYTGTTPPDFVDAIDAKTKMRNWVGNEEKFHPHVAQFDFEAWLLPYWNTIQRLAQHNKTAPSGSPESVNHNKPPSYYIKGIFEMGKCRKSYVKPRDAMRILNENDISISISQCPELKSFINTILRICNSPQL